MPIRALVVVASVVVGLALVPSGTAGAAPPLTADPPRAVAGLSVQVSGTCDTATGQSRSTSRDVQVGLVRDEAVVVVQAVSGTVPGSFTATVPLPPDMLPGGAVLESSCGGQLPFTVLAAPTLAATPSQVVVDHRVTVTGTCPAHRGDATDLELAGQRLTTAKIVSATGEFGPTTLTIASGSRPGRQSLTSSCGGATPLVVLSAAAPASASASTPASASASTVGPAALVTVPDLTGLTMEQAAAALGGRLLLDVGGSGPRITGQRPPPGARVQEGTSVAVVLAAATAQSSTTAKTTAFPVLAVVLAGVALLALMAKAAVLVRARRLRRERRWLDEDVDLRVAGGAFTPAPSDVPRPAGPGLEVRLVVRRQDPHAYLREVGHGPD